MTAEFIQGLMIPLITAFCFAVGQYVLEENTAWHCANKSYNQRSIGIELSNDAGARFSISPDGTLRSEGTPPTGWHNGNVIYICE